MQLKQIASFRVNILVWELFDYSIKYTFFLIFVFVSCLILDLFIISLYVLFNVFFDKLILKRKKVGITYLKLRLILGLRLSDLKVGEHKSIKL